MPFTIIRRDITQMSVDAIVNAANTDLTTGGGGCGAIFRAAGARELQAACDRTAPIKTGEAAITPGFALKAKYVIHAAAPADLHGGGGQNAKLLRSAYENALRLAADRGCGSIAFPLLSSDICGYPKADALRAATETIRDFLQDHDMDVYLAVRDTSAFMVSQALTGAVDSYIDENYIAAQPVSRRRLPDAEKTAPLNADNPFACMPVPSDAAPMAASGIDELVGRLDEPFSTTLLRLIDAKGRTDAEVYKRANIDRKLFSKIRTGKGYMPGKRTILALSVALELTLDETDDLLERAGYALSHSRKFDVIVEYFIVNQRYDIFEINEVLFKYDQPLLGG